MICTNHAAIDSYRPFDRDNRLVGAQLGRPATAQEYCPEYEQARALRVAMTKMIDAYLARLDATGRT